MNESLRKNQEDWQKSHKDLEKQLATEKESRGNQVAELSVSLSIRHFVTVLTVFFNLRTSFVM